MYARERAKPLPSGHASRVLVPPAGPGGSWQARSSTGTFPSAAEGGFDFARTAIFPPTTEHPAGPERSGPRCSCGGKCPECANPTGELGTGPEPMTAARGRTAEGVTTVNGGGGPAGPAAPAPAPAEPAAPAAPARSARLRSGPRYTPHGHLTPTIAGGFMNVPFVFDAEFDRDPANGVFPWCGEIHQDIKWDATARTNGNTQWGLTTPHGGFPAGHPANNWIEDRDGTDTFRYGHRRGPFATPVAGGNEYTNRDGTVNMASGPIYHGRDNPSGVPVAFTGRWSFMVLAFDMCNRGTQIGSADFIIIDW